MTQTLDSNSHLRWPAGSFYWALLEAPGWNRSGPLPDGLRAEFEDEAPLLPGELHAVCTPLKDGRVLVCAALQSELAALPPKTLSLLPEAPPACIELVDGGAACESLNLLVGRFEPRPLRSARTARHCLAATIVGLCGLLTVLGLSRRTAHWSIIADRAAAATNDILRSTVPQSASVPGALQAEVARLQQRSIATARIRPASDAALALTQILHAWPTDVSASTQMVTVSGTAAMISVNVEGDAARFLRAMGTPDGWTRGEPRLNSSGGVTRIVLGLASEPKEAGR